MTTAELDAVIRGIVPVVRGYIAAESAALVARVNALEARPQLTAELRESITESAIALCRRIEALEERAPVPGPAGAAGRDGVDGRDGPPGARGSDALIGPLAETVARLEDATHACVATLTRFEAAQLADEEVAALCEDVTRKAFGALPPAAPVRRMQKRVIRDGDGKIARIVEEPVAP